MKRQRSDSAASTPGGSPSIMDAFVVRRNSSGERIVSSPQSVPQTPSRSSRGGGTPSRWRTGRPSSAPSTPAALPWTGSARDALGRLLDVVSPRLLSFSELAAQTDASLRQLTETERDIVRLMYEESSPWVTTLRAERRFPRVPRDELVRALDSLESQGLVERAQPPPPLPFLLQTLTVEMLLELIGQVGAVVASARAEKASLVEALVQCDRAQSGGALSDRLGALLGGCYVLTKAVSQTVGVLVTVAFLDEADADAASTAEALVAREDRFVRNLYAAQRFVQRGGEAALSRLMRPYVHTSAYPILTANDEDRTVFPDAFRVRNFALALALNRHFDVLSAFLSVSRRWEAAAPTADHATSVIECWRQAIALLHKAASRLEELKRCSSPLTADPMSIPAVLGDAYASGAPVWMPRTDAPPSASDTADTDSPPLLEPTEWRRVPVMAADAPSIFTIPLIHVDTTDPAARPADLSASYLDDLSEGGLLARTLWHGVSLIDRMRVPAEVAQDVDAAQVRDWLQLLLYLPFHKGRRGKWWVRLVGVLKKLSPKYALEGCIQALNDPLCCAGQRIAVEARVQQLLKIRPPLTTRSFPPSPMLGVSDVDTIEAIRAPIKGARPMWFLPGDTDAPEAISSAVHVETFAMAHYTDSGRNGLAAQHCEGSLWRALFYLLLADEIYAAPQCGVAGIFRHRYQFGPLDLHAMNDFYMNRVLEIESKLERIEQGAGPAIVAAALDRLHAQDNQSRAMWLGSYTSDVLVSVARASPPKALAAIVRALSRNLSGLAAGMPDLVVWDPSEAAAAVPSLRLVEVKGPNDRLSDEQRHWIHVLVESGARVTLCHVRAAGEPVQEDDLA